MDAIKFLKEKKRMCDRYYDIKGGIRMSNAEIVDVFNRLDEDDISTERILSMVADTCGIEVDDVVTALIAEGVAKPADGV